jgi:hypothetical protein
LELILVQFSYCLIIFVHYLPNLQLIFLSYGRYLLIIWCFSSKSLFQVLIFFYQPCIFSFKITYSYGVAFSLPFSRHLQFIVIIFESRLQIFVFIHPRSEVFIESFYLLVHNSQFVFVFWYFSILKCQFFLLLFWWRHLGRISF